MDIKLKSQTSSITKLSLHLLIVSLLFVSFTTFWNWPAISSGLPYFYNEDEAHHFNRTVEMVKTGDYNPNYFLKPSLHFYLRMPVVAAGFLWQVKKGQIKTLQDIRTRDRHGLSGYSFTASHPGLVKLNRILSLALATGAIIFASFIAFNVTGGSLIAFTLTGLLLSLSPAIALYGTSIGVDAPMLFFCVAAVFFALRYKHNSYYFNLFLSALCAGLAISSKYNALPIMLAPIAAALLTQPFSIFRLATAGLVPIASFIAGSPYILISLPQFLDHFAYEIWHYGVATHVGHTAEPGLEQAWFYTKYISTQGLGIFAVLFAIVGAAFLTRKNWKSTVVVLIFPLCYFLLMSMQRTNFERNMLVVLPFIAIVASVLTFEITKHIKVKRSYYIGLALLAVLLTGPIITKSLGVRSEFLNQPDSRNQVVKWLKQNTPAHTDTALSGTLQLPLFQTTIKGNTQITLLGIERLGIKEFDFRKLYLNGYSRLVVGPEIDVSQAESNGYKLIKEFPGVLEPQRVINNPNIKIFEVNDSQLPQVFLKAQTSLSSLRSDCNQEAEGQCWVNEKLSKLPLPKDKMPQSLSFDAFSPWSNQTIKVVSNGQTLEGPISLTNSWARYTINIPASTDVLLLLGAIHSPAKHGLSNDERRLGFAYKNLSWD